MTEYAWRKNRGFPVAPNIVGKAVQAIADKEGACTPAALVDKARSVKSPLHPLFEWDDAVAAEKHRIHTARQVTSSLCIISVASESCEPAFVHIREVKEDGVTEGYLSLDSVRASPTLLEFVIGEALESLKGWKRRYGHLAAVQGIVEAIDEFDASLAGELVSEA